MFLICESPFPANALFSLFPISLGSPLISPRREEKQSWSCAICLVAADTCSWRARRTTCSGQGMLSSFGFPHAVITSSLAKNLADWLAYNLGQKLPSMWNYDFHRDRNLIRKDSVWWWVSERATAVCHIVGWAGVVWCPPQLQLMIKASYRVRTCFQFHWEGSYPATI